MTTRRAQQSPNLPAPAPWATGRHSTTPPPVPPRGAGTWTPTSPEPPRKRGGTWKWIVGVLAVLVVGGLVVNGLGAAELSAQARTAEATTVPPSAAADADQRQREQLDETLDSIGERLNERRAAAGMPLASHGGEMAAAYGEPIDVMNLVVSSERPTTVSLPYAGGQVCAEVSYRNTGSRSESFNKYDWKFQSSGGATASITAAWGGGSQALDYGVLAPGESVSGLVCGDLQTTDVAGVIYEPGYDLGDKVVWSD